MKKKLFINLSIRLRFIFMIMLELVCVSLISWLVMDVLHISAAVSYTHLDVYKRQGKIRQLAICRIFR